MQPKLALFPSLLLSACGMLPENSASSAPISAEGSLPAPEKKHALEQVALVLECEKHIRSWKKLMALPKSSVNEQARISLEDAFATLLHNNRATLESLALNGEARFRPVCSASLGFTKDVSVLPVMLNNIGSSEKEVVSETLFGLAAFAHPDTPTEALRSLLTQDDLPLQVLHHGAFAVSRIADARRSDPQGDLEIILLHFLNRPEPYIRAQAASGLGRIQAVQSLPRLTNLLAADSDANVRTAAAYALGAIRHPSSAPALISALQDPSKLTAGTARASLAKMHGKDLGGNPQVWIKVFP